MKASEVKTKLLKYWRFQRRFFFAATEVWPYEADVMVSDERTIIECEVKVSKYDLRNDFSKRKHKVYASPYPGAYVPNQFYFAVPAELVGEARELVAEHRVPYGIIKVSDMPLSTAKRVDYCAIVHRAKLLTGTFSKGLHRSIILRMGSELIRSRLKFPTDVELAEQRVEELRLKYLEEAWMNAEENPEHLHGELWKVVNSMMEGEKDD